MRHYIVAAMLALAPFQVAAQESPNPSPKEQLDEAARAAEEAMRNLVAILDLLVRSIPQYEPPVILENGDILIRRVHKEDKAPADTAPDDESKT